MPQKLQSNYLKKEKLGNNYYFLIDIKQAAEDFGLDLFKFPYSLRILFENVVRHSRDLAQDLVAFKAWLENNQAKTEINFRPARILMQDFTGVPAIVDLASMRDAAKKIGIDPQKINPLIPVDLVIDHSVQVDSYGQLNSFTQNMQKEIERNLERYQFLKWGQKAFTNFRVVPPGTGICHQVNLEYLAKTIYTEKISGLEVKLAYPDSLVGTDSHTTMVNALAVLGWGVGGIEAEAAMLGQAIPMLLPEVVGVRLTGSLTSSITATDLVLTITEKLRHLNVVGKFVEFFGEGVQHLSLADRATIANMAPEYGATCGFFATDEETLRYLSLTGRDQEQIELVEAYSKKQALWQEANSAIPSYNNIVDIDLSLIETSLAGPKRPQDRVAMSKLATNFQTNLSHLAKHSDDLTKDYKVTNQTHSLKHGDIVIAAITSCTNTSNPYVMIAAGLVAKKALEFGLKTKNWVKTSLAPGSQVVTEYLAQTGLDQALNQLGFNLVGYGCTSCIGNSGPLLAEIEQTIKENNLIVASILSGNRNFEGRIHPSVQANYLASPPLVIAYALAGTVNINLATEPIGHRQNQPIYLRDLWPSAQEIQKYIKQSIQAELFHKKYQNIFLGDQYWQEIKVKESVNYHWDKKSTYINNPPYFDHLEAKKANLKNIEQARILALFGDSVTTDHISPAGTISHNSPAATYLTNQGVSPQGFNSYGARRGNHEVMMRGTFANIRIKNLLCPGTEGGVTIHYDSGKMMSIYDAAMAYQQTNTDLVIFAGAEYGTGSSRDWAAKGTNLLGIRAVIAESFERIHRSNLIGMGVLPLSFDDDIKISDLKLTGRELINITGINAQIKPKQKLKLVFRDRHDNNKEINLKLQLYTEQEISYIRNGNILGAVLKNIMNGDKK